MDAVLDGEICCGVGWARRGYDSRCFVTDLARILRISRTTIDRMRRYRSFPIRELPVLDKRPRWSGTAVRRFLESQSYGSLRRRRRPGGGPRPPSGASSRR